MYAPIALGDGAAPRGRLRLCSAAALASCALDWSDFKLSSLCLERCACCSSANHQTTPFRQADAKKLEAAGCPASMSHNPNRPNGPRTSSVCAAPSMRLMHHPYADDQRAHRQTHSPARARPLSPDFRIDNTVFNVDYSTTYPKTTDDPFDGRAYGLGGGGRREPTRLLAGLQGR